MPQCRSCHGWHWLRPPLHILVVKKSNSIGTLTSLLFSGDAPASAGHGCPNAEAATDGIGFGHLSIFYHQPGIAERLAGPQPKRSNLESNIGLRAKPRRLLFAPKIKKAAPRMPCLL